MFFDFLNFNISRRGTRYAYGAPVCSISQDLGIIRFFMKKYGVSMRSAYAMYGRFVLTGDIK